MDRLLTKEAFSIKHEIVRRDKESLRKRYQSLIDRYLYGGRKIKYKKKNMKSFKKCVIVESFIYTDFEIRIVAKTEAGKITKLSVDEIDW